MWMVWLLLLVIFLSLNSWGTVFGVCVCLSVCLSAFEACAYNRYLLHQTWHSDPWYNCILHLTTASLLAIFQLSCLHGEFARQLETLEIVVMLEATKPDSTSFKTSITRTGLFLLGFLSASFFISTTWCFEPGFLNKFGMLNKCFVLFYLKKSTNVKE